MSEFKLSESVTRNMTEEERIYYRSGEWEKDPKLTDYVPDYKKVLKFEPANGRNKHIIPD